MGENKKKVGYNEIEYENFFFLQIKILRDLENFCLHLMFWETSFKKMAKFQFDAKFCKYPPTPIKKNWDNYGLPVQCSGMFR